MRRPSPQKKFPFHDAQNHPPRNVSRIKTRFISPKSVSVLSSRHSFPSSLFFSRARILNCLRSGLPFRGSRDAIQRVPPSPSLFLLPLQQRNRGRSMGDDSVQRGVQNFHARTSEPPSSFVVDETRGVVAPTPLSPPVQFMYSRRLRLKGMSARSRSRLRSRQPSPITRIRLVQPKSWTSIGQKRYLGSLTDISYFSHD